MTDTPINRFLDALYHKTSHKATPTGNGWQATALPTRTAIRASVSLRAMTGGC